MLNETTERYLEQMNVPTRKDISKIFSLIVNVDTKVDDLENLLEEAGAKQLSRTELQFKIENFEKKLESVDAKLNQILTQVNYLIEVNNKKAADTTEAAKITPTANNKEVRKINAAAKNRRTVKNKVATKNKRAASNKDD
jgi:polyhydroxyalkanoic acid synthase PhaR subunit